MKIEFKHPPETNFTLFTKAVSYALLLLTENLGKHVEYVGSYSNYNEATNVYSIVHTYIIRGELHLTMEFTTAGTSYTIKHKDITIHSGPYSSALNLDEIISVIRSLLA